MLPKYLIFSRGKMERSYINNLFLWWWRQSAGARDLVPPLWVQTTVPGPPPGWLPWLRRWLQCHNQTRILPPRPDLPADTLTMADSQTCQQLIFLILDDRMTILRLLRDKNKQTTWNFKLYQCNIYSRNNLDSFTLSRNENKCRLPNGVNELKNGWLMTFNEADQACARIFNILWWRCSLLLC